MVRPGGAWFVAVERPGAARAVAVAWSVVARLVAVVRSGVGGRGGAWRRSGAGLVAAVRPLKILSH